MHGLYAEAAKTWPRLVEAVDRILSSDAAERHMQLLARYEACLEELASGLRDTQESRARRYGFVRCQCGKGVFCKTCNSLAPIERYMKALERAQFLHTELAKKQQFMASVAATDTVNKLIEQVIKVLNDKLMPGQLADVVRALDSTVKLPVAELD